MTTPSDPSVEQAQAALDEHLRRIIDWHFSPDTGCPYWLQWARDQGWDPRREIRTFRDLSRFPHFQDQVLRGTLPEQWIPKPYQGRPFHVFETGGTTGMPKQRIGWDDYQIDYEEFSRRYDHAVFPLGTHWLMLGPTGPRRLRLAIEHLANIRGGSCYFVDLDPRWVKKTIAAKQFEVAKAYLQHVVEQGLEILKHRPIGCLFTTPKLLEALGEKINLADAGIKGVFCGGTSMTPQMVRFLVEEVLDQRVAFVPTYGNTLMGLACSEPLSKNNHYNITYHAPQPRAVLRVVDPHNTSQTVAYGQWGRVELTTLTQEFFMPRFLERDQAIRRPPAPQHGWPWDGVGDVRPFSDMNQPVVEGVY